MTDSIVKSYDGHGATTLWFPLSIHGRFNCNRWGLCIDCGIDEGQYSKQYSTLFDNVISIDASIRAQTYEYLKDCDNIQLLEKCLWNKSGEIVTWYELEYHTFLSSTNKEHVVSECEKWDIDKGTISEYNVKTEILDNLIHQPVDFIKIDCETSDTSVIEGAEQTIIKYKPTIQIESPTIRIENLLSKYDYKKFQHTEHNFTDTIYLPT